METRVQNPKWVLLLLKLAVLFTSPGYDAVREITSRIVTHCHLDDLSSHFKSVLF